MRIERDQLIAELPARDVRRFMREAAGFIIRVRTVTDVLGCSERRALELLKNLQDEGLLAATEDFWEATAKGHALAMATAAPPLRRATAERLIEQVVERTGGITAYGSSLGYERRNVHSGRDVRCAVQESTG